MKNVILLLLVIVFATSADAQEMNVTEVAFSGDKIVLNGINCFNYIKTGNDFSITDLNKNEVISGHIAKNGLGVFECLVTFTAIGQKFANAQMVGRNALIFALVKENVFDKTCGINVDKLKAFVKNHNELK